MATDTEKTRKQYPSGWVQISTPESQVLIIDALLEAPPSREFTQPELASKAEVSEKSVRTHINTLVELGIVKELDERSSTRYTLNPESYVLQEIVQLNSVVSRIKNDELSKLKQEPRRDPVDRADVVNTPDSSRTESKTTKPDQIGLIGE